MIKLKNISKHYSKNGSPEVRALDKVSLEIKKGSFLAIVGSSGSGKSTLMNIMGLLDRPSSGVYTLDNRKVEGVNENELARLRNQKIGFVFQSFHLLQRTTAKENVELPLVYAGSPNSSSTAIELLKSVGLEDRMNHYPKEMSGGEQQRVAIARALMNNPEIILADEPTGNLDSKASKEVMKILQDLNRKGHTIILITHEQEIADHANRIIRIEDGRIADDQIVKNPKIA